MRRLFFLPFLLLFSYCEAQKLNRAALGLVAPKNSICTAVKDQYMSSTCWSFSSTSLLESELMKMGKGKIDLSEMFIARYSMLRKIHRHLKLKGGNFFTPGGQFHDVVWVMKNFGLVPEEAYSGKTQGAFNHHHAEMDTIFSRFVKDCVKAGITELDTKQDAWVDSVLNEYLGPVPPEFVYKERTYTPHSFLEQYLELNPDDYIEITSYTHHPFYKKFVLENKYNWTGDEYYNVAMADFSAITDHAIANGYTVSWDGDAQDEHFDFNEGLAWLPQVITDFQLQRQQAFTSKATELDHMMHIVGSVKDKKGDKWYYIKNSWGNYSNPLGGFLFMRDDYFKIRTVAIIVNKKAIPAGIQKKLGL
ncbi:MAG: C1 family peptidase [Bacteroidota bacterium]|nr:C1 family peptidase [Bacteroidota bacterium]